MAIHYDNVIGHMPGFFERIVSGPTLDACWTWSGGRFLNFGYGSFHVGKQRYIAAHRASWMIYNGDIPRGMCVLHKCDNPICANPHHLMLGTKGDNNSDRHKKGRTNLQSLSKFWRGENNFAAKLTVEQVRIIKERIACGDRNCDIAVAFGTTDSTICDIKHGRRWKLVLAKGERK